MIRALLFALSISLLLPTLASAADRPNIVLFLADDLGIECVESYGGLSYKTPNIDRLAKSGMRFTHCFADPYCSPSRAQLLTGRYPLHNGIPRVIFLPDQHREFLDPAKETSVAKLLKEAGYATAMAGKWQLSFLEERDTIAAHGFDEYQAWQIFNKGAKTSRYANPTMRQNGEVVSTPGGYGPDENLAFVTDFIERHQDQPFFVYYACLLPHWPWEPTPDSKDPLTAGKGDGDPKYMADMVSYLDKQVGQVAATLDRLGLRDNTILIFVADNGTDQRLVTNWTDGSIERRIPGGKSHMTDTGTRVPLIVSWPGKVKAGSVNNDLVDLSDLLPTLIELANAKASPQPINGVSFAAQLRGETGTPRTWIHVQKENQRHVRNEQFILNNQGKLRPIVEYGLKEPKPVSPDSSAEAKESHAQLQEAMNAAETFGKRSAP
ncbi:sulfatase-like hydrolase/transferase [Blastopirellula sp. JC732]|uniref:Sulfatase-like hydrolase/transferase n=1 Tax=Blastopirellula sediminis TaxID=2894196 RepID=A0A9X1SGC0_9BACT|nr:sulfatase-like hydrolase/transferase [Blastopirellula sediminis]MCC9606663.1 sulfatase-like hydrolase/transferase [Blastopirellula sediminis]MCC9630040.1 sulfatase-like hydrolase/transferase [Blastopirellula sediminis]